MVSLPKQIRSRVARAPAALSRYRRHKQLRRARYPWNSIPHELRWAVSDPPAIARLTERRLQLAPHHWVFIAGCHNSGTTLVRDVLASHPSVRGLPREGQTLAKKAFPRPKDYGVERAFAKRLDVFHWTEDHDGAPALRAKYDWARYFERRPGNLLVKHPLDAVRTRWLQRHFVPSRFIVMVRSPYPVAEGTRRRTGHSIEDAAEQWTRVNECLLSDMLHLKDHLMLRYEDFCATPEEHLRRLEAFLELDSPFGAEALAPRKVHSIDNQVSRIQNQNAKSIERLSHSDIEAIGAIAGRVMERLGYERL